MTLAAGTRLGPYEILAPLGAGGMGEVYRARDTRLGREVAVKVLPAVVSADPERLRRFEKEARSASSLNHPNIVTLYDIGESGGVSFIAMELVEGQTLRELLAEGALVTKRLLAVAAQVADGLAKAHGAGIVHRDLKPENVMVTKDGFAKILDFGLAKLTQPDPPEGQETHSPTVSAGTEPGVVMGTVGYMSPEQALGKALDFRSDQFSFGSVLYEMATGKPAFARGNTPETMAAIIREEPEPIASVAASTPVPLRWAIERCLAKDPEERYASTRDLARDLARLRDGISEGSLSGAAFAVAAPPVRLSRRLLPAALILLAGIGAGVAVTRRPREEPPVYRAVTFRRGSIGGARFAPDGQTIVYAAAWQGSPLRLYSTRTDSTESTALPLPSADLVSISSSGKMAIHIDRDPNPGILAEVSLAGGAPRELLEGGRSGDWTPTGDRLAIARRGRLEFPIGKVLYDPGPGKSARAPRFSPDGRSIAFIEESGDRSSIAVVDLAGKKKTLSEGWEAAMSVAWHPGTGEVWFSAREVAGFGVINLQAVSLSGRHRVVARGPLLLILADIARDGRVLLRSDDWPTTMMCLPPGASKELDLTWLDYSISADLSDDGQELLFTEEGSGAGARGSVYLRKTDGSPAVRLGDGRGEALSPDKKWALSRRTDGFVLLPTGPGEPRTVRTHGLEPQFASWFPDGKQILFFAGAPGRPPRLYVQDATGGAPRSITPEGFHGESISPDGKLVAARGENRKAFLFPVDGGEPRPLPGIAPTEGIVRFDATGGKLFLMSFNLPLRIERFEIASGRRELWKEIVLADPTGVEGIESVQLTPDGKSYAYTFMRSLSRLYLVEGLR